MMSPLRTALFSAAVRSLKKKIFEDLAQATFCLQKAGGAWKVTHQHIFNSLRPRGED